MGRTFAEVVEQVKDLSYEEKQKLLGLLESDVLKERRLETVEALSISEAVDEFPISTDREVKGDD